MDITKCTVEYCCKLANYRVRDRVHELASNQDSIDRFADETADYVMPVQDKHLRQMLEDNPELLVLRDGYVPHYELDTVYHNAFEIIKRFTKVAVMLAILEEAEYEID